MRELRIKDICTKQGSSIKQKDVLGSRGKYPVYGASGVIGSIDSFHQDKDYIAIVKDGSGIGRVMFLPAQSSVIGTLQYILPKSGYDIKYIGYCLQSLGLSSYKQGAAIPHIYFRDYGERVIRVADSINEQRRIVFYINSCFSKIDEMLLSAKSGYDEANALLKTYISECISRKEGWHEKKIKSLIRDIHYGTSKPSIEGGQYPYLRMNNISSDGHLVLKDLKSISLPESELKNCIVRKGDILFNRTNSLEHVGKTCVFDLDDPMVIAGYIIRIRLTDEVIPQYFSYFINSDTTKRVLRRIAVGAVHQSNISASNIQKVSISYPSVSEQEHIVRRISELENRVNHLRHNYETMRSECELMKLQVLKGIFE